MKKSNTVSKSKFKAKALEYFRLVEKSRKPLIITDHGKPVLKIAPFSVDPAELLKELRGTLVQYEAPLEPVGEADWRVLK